MSIKKIDWGYWICQVGFYNILIPVYITLAYQHYGLALAWFAWVTIMNWASFSHDKCYKEYRDSSQGLIDAQEEVLKVQHKVIERLIEKREHLLSEVSQLRKDNGSMNDGIHYLRSLLIEHDIEFSDEIPDREAHKMSTEGGVLTVEN